MKKKDKRKQTDPILPPVEDVSFEDLVRLLHKMKPVSNEEIEKKVKEEKKGRDNKGE